MCSVFHFDPINNNPKMLTYILFDPFNQRNEKKKKRTSSDEKLQRRLKQMECSFVARSARHRVHLTKWNFLVSESENRTVRNRIQLTLIVTCIHLQCNIMPFISFHFFCLEILSCSFYCVTERSNLSSSLCFAFTASTQFICACRSTNGKLKHTTIMQCTQIDKKSNYIIA